MKQFGNIIAVVLTAFLVSSCLFKNDLSYPQVDMAVTSIELEGQVSVTIDREARHIDVVMGETADLSNVRILDIQLSKDTFLVGEHSEYVNLTAPVEIVLKAYEEVVWTLSATQPIARYIRVENQVGEAEINPDKRSAVVYVTENQPLGSVVFNEVKLEREGSEVLSTTGTVNVGGRAEEQTELCAFPMTLNCFMSRVFTVIDAGRTCTWLVEVKQVEVELEVSSVNAWATKASVTALYDGTGEPYLEYCKISEQSWTGFKDVTVTSAGLSGDITGLQPDTGYQVRVVNGSEVSDAYAFRTESAQQLGNMSFDDWHLDGKVWYPYTSGLTFPHSVWDSANPGAAAMIGSSTTPEEDFVVNGKAARLESKYAVIAFAAGNIYTGKFGNIAGVGAELDWGVPFTSRPTALKGYYNYTPKPIDRLKAEKLEAGGFDPSALEGAMDKCQIQVFLADWTAPFHVNTTTGTFVDMDAEYIIASARLETDEASGDGYKEFRLDLKYRDKKRKPTYVVISACASYLGDYFTGGVGSLLYIDEFEFVY